MNNKQRSRDRDGVYTRKDRSGFFISYKDANGKYRRRKTHARTKTEAKKIRAEYLVRAERMRIMGVAEAEDITFEAVTERYLKYQKPRISAKAYARIKGIIEKHLKPAFPGKICAITRASISDYVTNRLNEASASTAEKEFDTVKHLLRLAHAEWNMIPANPAAALTLKSLGIKVSSGRVRYLRQHELPDLLSACPAWLCPIVILAVATGLRRGNLVNLRWTDCDEQNRRIIIQKTKNGEPLIVHLNEMGLFGLARAEAQFGRSQIGRVFPDITDNQVSVAFKRACSKAGIKDFRFHDLRHTTGSWLAMSGVDIHAIAKVLGHRDIRMTARYSHLSSDFLASNTKKLDGVFLLPVQQWANCARRCDVASIERVPTVNLSHPSET